MNRNLFVAGGIFFILLALIFRPVPAATVHNTIDHQLTVANIWEGGIKDVVFSFENSPKKPYINRGLENGLNLEELKQELVGKECTFKFIEYFRLLNISYNNPTVAYIETSDGKVIYDAIKH